MDSLVSWRSDDGVLHPYMHLQSQVDEAKVRALRSQQRAYLARYGRQDYWGSHTLPEINEAVKRISEILSRENEAQQMSES